jgi:peptide deformylase
MRPARSPGGFRPGRHYTEFVTEIEQETREERAEREARRLYVLASVRQYPDPVLRMRTHEVTEFDDALRTLVARMISVMQRSQGVGLAAPQLGVLARVLVHQADEDTEPVALVNPHIVASSPEREAADEGCLSLDAAGVTVEVERPVAVTVEARSPSGDQVRVEVDGLAARVIQHEVDHLDGVLIIDRTTPDQRKVALGMLRPQPVLGAIQPQLSSHAASSKSR